MLEFINNNGVLFSGIFGIITALITAVVAIIIDNKKSKQDTIRVLKKELGEAKQELDKCRKRLSEYESFEKSEANIDKTDASIYKEKLPNGGTRNICGFCWEKEHIKIPLNVDICYEEYTKQYYYDGFCNSCKSHCISNIE